MYSKVPMEKRACFVEYILINSERRRRKCLCANPKKEKIKKKQELQCKRTYTSIYALAMYWNLGTITTMDDSVAIV